MIYYIYIFLISLASVLVFTPLMRFIARKTKILDLPNSRKAHREPTPLLGGLAIYLGFVISLAVTHKLTLELVVVFFSSFIILILGLLDDLRNLSVESRLIIQLFAVLLVAKYVLNLPFSIPSLIVTGLGVLWMVGITNMINLEDNIDGLAAGLTLVSSGILLFLALRDGKVLFASLSAALAGSSFGFLFYNFHPATIFMGDAGSTFLGFTLAFISLGTLLNSRPDPISLTTLLVPLLALGVPIYDTILVTVLRIKDGHVKSLSQWFAFSGTDHFSHRLINLGLTQRQTVLVLCSLSLVLGTLALTIHKLSPLQIILVLFILCLFGFLLGLKLDKGKRP